MRGELLKSEDVPIVTEVPPGLQGIIEDFCQPPIESVGKVEGRKWMGDSRRLSDVRTETGPAISHTSLSARSMTYATQ
jgi:hypothetical protein